MPELVANCPRCDSVNMTFDVLSNIQTHVKYDWQKHLEAFCVCRHCGRSTVFRLAERNIRAVPAMTNGGLMGTSGKAINDLVSVEGYINISDFGSEKPPEHVPAEIGNVFDEGAKCMAIGCHNAAATMFRLCVDLATKPMLPAQDVNGINTHIRRTLGNRLVWLFDNSVLPESFRELSNCIKEDGNDGAHAGTLSENDSRDLLDFTKALLERLYTEPEKIRLAKERRTKRRET